jgi:phosphoserine phosphatase
MDAAGWVSAGPECGDSMKRIDLIGFDVDGTLIRHPQGRVIWEVLNLRFGGTDEQNRQRYQRYLNGDVTYDQWVEMDVSDWIRAGATREDVMNCVAEFELIGGAREAVDELKAMGFKLAVISGTIDIVIDTLFPEHPFDDVYTNRVFFNSEGLLDSWRATPFDWHGKADALRQISARHGVPLSRSAFVGDGDNDVSLLGVSGFFVAFQPRSQRLAREADVVISDNTLHRLPEVFRPRCKGE